MKTTSSGTPSVPRPEDENLGVGANMAYGLQHVLTMYGGIVAVPLILGQAAGLADSLARSAFAGTDCLRGFELLPQLTAEECAAFVSEHLAPERLALAVVQPEPRKDM